MSHQHQSNHSVNASNQPYFLGINCAHDAAACLVGDEGILVAIREERLARRKHLEGLPKRAIGYCLESLALESLDSVAAITINQYPKMDCERELLDMGYSGPIHVNPSHHLLHAYYARYFAAKRDVLIVVADGSGYSYGEYKRSNSPMLGSVSADDDADEAETVFAVRGGMLSLRHKRWGVWKASTPYFRFPSLGHAYAVAAQHIYKGLHGWRYAAKVMGLAPYGELTAPIPPMVRRTQHGFEFDLEWCRRLPAVNDDPEYWNDPNRRAIAARAQHDLEMALLAWFRDLAQPDVPSTVCFTGGVAHNSVANGKLAADQRFTEYLFTPAADDAGTAIGGALYAFEQALGRVPQIGYANEFHGRTYQRDEIDSAVVCDPRVRLTLFSSPELFAMAAAEELRCGRFVALHDGGSEFSARALGHRSIFCDPRKRDAKQDLNARVKFREAFRPYAAMVLEERVEEYFQSAVKSPHMMVVARVRPDKIDQIPAVCHVDGTCRVQTVPGDYDGIAAALLRAFHAQTGVPILLNTSLNIRGEPIVETPTEAIDCLCATGLDVLYMYPYRVEKHPLSWDLSDVIFASSVPVLNGPVALETRQDSSGAGWNRICFWLRTKTGYARELTHGEYELLAQIDGKRSVAELVCSDSNPTGTLSRLKRLNDIGAIAFARFATAAGGACEQVIARE